MIFSVLLRSFKTFKSAVYVPVSNSSNFSAIVGENGVGKSTVLEALNTYFNEHEWNYNQVALTKGFSEREPYICPVFLIEKSGLELKEKLAEFLDCYSRVVWELEKNDFNSSNFHLAEQFIEHRKYIFGDGVSKDTHYLFPFGIIRTAKSSANDFYLSIFDSAPKCEDIFSKFNKTENLSLLDDFIRERYRYIYIPSEIDVLQYTRIEGDTVQALMGKRLEDVVKGFIKDDHVRQINTSLNGFIDKVSKRLGCYEYKKPAKKQNLFNQSHLASKVIEAYFDSKVLNLKQGGISIPVYGLSSGEKRRALIDIAKAFLAEYMETGGRKVVLAIDEPEISLDLVSRLDQFEKLREISVSGVQVLITTHWYGFMPVVSDGTVTCVHSVDSKPFHMIDLRCFRDDVKKLKKETNGVFPLEIELRGINELVQSVIASITNDERKWLICEGVSDQIYIKHFFGDIQGVVVLPIGASKNVKKFYEYLLLALDDDRESVQGRVFLLLDTDKRAEAFDAKEGVGWISIRRLLNDKQTGLTKLLKTSDNIFFPPTEIEDVLNPELFVSSLIKVANDNGWTEYAEKFSLFSIKDSTFPSGLAFDFRDSDRELIEDFFDKRGIKIKFALAYVQSDQKRKIPAWFSEVTDFLSGRNSRSVRTKAKNK